MKAPQETQDAPDWKWTAKRKFIFLAATLIPLLLAFSMTKSNGILWHMAEFHQPGNSFSFCYFIYHSWLEFLDTLEWGTPILLIIFFTPLYILWWRKPDFLKSYVIGLFVFLIGGYFSSIPFHVQEESYKELLARFPDFAQSLPSLFRLLLKIWPA